jgi:hypothetical protein
VALATAHSGWSTRLHDAQAGVRERSLHGNGIVSLGRAFALRPSLVFWLWIPAERIRTILPAGEAVAEAMIEPRRSKPSIYMEFAEPLDAETIPGLSKRASAVGITVYDPAGFDYAVRQLYSPPRPDALS